MLLKRYGPTKGVTQKSGTSIKMKVKGSGTKGKAHATNRYGTITVAEYIFYKKTRTKILII
jgi:hypothetical protein